MLRVSQITDFDVLGMGVEIEEIFNCGKKCDMTD